MLMITELYEARAGQEKMLRDMIRKSEGSCTRYCRPRSGMFRC
jgi:hypothetical protein